MTTDKIYPEDTVMSIDEINYIRNSTVARDIAENAMNNGYQVGRKEVVEWVESHAHKQHDEYFIADWEWQVFKKKEEK